MYDWGAWLNKDQSISKLAVRSFLRSPAPVFLAGGLGEVEIRQYRVAKQVCMVDQLRVSGRQFRSLPLSVLAMVRPERHCQRGWQARASADGIPDAKSHRSRVDRICSVVVWGISGLYGNQKTKMPLDGLSLRKHKAVGIMVF